MSPQTQADLSLEELLRLPQFFAPRVSDAGDRAAFYADWSGRMELYVLDLPLGRLRQLSNGEVPRSPLGGFCWTRAGDALIFGRDTEGDEQHDLYRIALDSGAVTRMTDHPGCQEYPVELSPGDGWLLFGTNRVGQMNLWRMRSDGSEEQQLTRYANPVQSGHWSPDGGWISFNANESDDLRNVDGYVMRADGSEARRVFRVSEGTRDGVGEWSADGTMLAVVSDASGDNRTGLLTLDGGEVRWLSPEGADESPVHFSPDGRYLLCVRNREAQLQPVLYDLATGAGRELSLPAGVLSGAEFALGGAALLLGHASGDLRPALIAYELAGDAVKTLVEPSYGALDPHDFVQAEHIYYKSFDGMKIPALLFRPRGVAAGAGLPALVHVHGGPTSQFMRSFDAFTQWLVSRGHVVLAPNIRGSTGYGRAFREANLRDWGGADLEDVAAGARLLAALPEVDPKRIGIFGTSYGGFMTYVATTKRPELWKAAAAWVGMTDLLRLYDASMAHFKYYLRSQLGDPVENAELWADRSAVNFAGNLQAKLLMLQGANDPRVPVEQAELFRDALLAHDRREGVDFEYVQFADAGHGTFDPDQRVRAFSLMAGFLQRNL